MKISMHAMSVQVFTPALQSLGKILEKGAQHAAARKFDPGVLAQARLAPDMFPLVKQVQLACDFGQRQMSPLEAHRRSTRTPRP